MCKMFMFESRVELLDVFKLSFDEMDELPSLFQVFHHGNSADFIAGQERQKGSGPSQVVVDQFPEDGPQLADRQNLKPFHTLSQHSGLRLLRKQVAQSLDVAVIEVFAVEFFEVVSEDVEDLELLLAAAHQTLDLSVAFEFRRKERKHVVDQIGFSVLLQTLLALPHDLPLLFAVLLFREIFSQRNIASLFQLDVAFRAQGVGGLEIAGGTVFLVVDLEGGGVVHAEGVVDGEGGRVEGRGIGLFGSVVVGNEGRGVVEGSVFVGGEEGGLRGEGKGHLQKQQLSIHTTNFQFNICCPLHSPIPVSYSLLIIRLSSTCLATPRPDKYSPSLCRAIMFMHGYQGFGRFALSNDRLVFVQLLDGELMVCGECWWGMGGGACVGRVLVNKNVRIFEKVINGGGNGGYLYVRGLAINLAGEECGDGFIGHRWDELLCLWGCR